MSDERAGRAGQAPGTESALVARASAMASELLEQLDDDGRRWRHTVAVAARARSAAPAFTRAEAEVLEAAAWLHDIGYAPAAVHTGFHPIDGADYVRSRLHNDAVAGLIAQHSGARFVAAARSMSDLMLPFAGPDFQTGPVADALTWADQTTGPDGGTVSVEQRLHETLVRHGPDSPNARAQAQRAPAIIAAVRATEARLAAVHERAGDARRSARGSAVPGESNGGAAPGPR